jgi:uncharacterized protein DUF4082
MFCQTLSLLFGASLVIAIGGSVASAQSLNIFGNAVPYNSIDDPGATTLGVKFWSSQPGSIVGIRFYRAVVSPQGYVAKLYSGGGTLLASATIAKESGLLPGWQEADFASPISISANTTYVATYYCPVGQGAWDQHELDNGVTNGPLTAPAGGMVGGNGVYISGNAFPTIDYAHDNYYVDVAFIPAAGTSPSLVLRFDPPNPSITSSAPLGSVVATISATWSDGGPFTGTLSFAQPYSNDKGTFAISGNSLIVNPSGPGISADANTTRNVTIVATQ